MKKPQPVSPSFEERLRLLDGRRNLKMARSAHAYVRGSTDQFYEWLTADNRTRLPDGPPVWICGDCHVGNLGPVAAIGGQIDIQIRDLDQTVIGNPAHDLIRLALSLATAARGSDLPGVTTARMLEEMIRGYEQSLADPSDGEIAVPEPSAVRVVRRRALGRKWRHLAKERIADVKPQIPIGKRFWSLHPEEREAIESLFQTEPVRRLATALKSRDPGHPIAVLDAAYWIKGCSSLGLLRYAVLLRVGDPGDPDRGLCLIDIKEARDASAPRAPGAVMPSDHAERVVEGARQLAPNLGDRMLASHMLGKPVFLRELMPQDLKIEIDQFTDAEAVRSARYLAAVVGLAHARQMDAETRRHWAAQLAQRKAANLDAPSWLWSSVVELAARHEAGYLEHCRRFAMAAA